MQSAVDYVISLEYMQQIDQREHMYRKDSLTCSPHRKMAPSCDYKKAHYNVGAHDPVPNWSVYKPYHGKIPMEETNTILPDHKQKGPLNSILLQNRMTSTSTTDCP
jgi:hypothetical protein